jgi:hypothetical protein
LAVGVALYFSSCLIFKLFVANGDSLLFCLDPWTRSPWSRNTIHTHFLVLAQSIFAASNFFLIFAFFSLHPIFVLQMVLPADRI